MTRIIIAEDEMINLQVLKSQLAEEGQGIIDRCDFCFNGQEAIDQAKKVMTDGVDAETGWSASIMPVCLMLLDFQMPRKNGIQVVEQVRRYVQQYNDNANTIVQLREPVFVFLTAHTSRTFKNHLHGLKVGGVYEKPLQQEKLKDILQLVDD